MPFIAHCCSLGVEVHYSGRSRIYSLIQGGLLWANEGKSLFWDKFSSRSIKNDLGYRWDVWLRTSWWGLTWGESTKFNREMHYLPLSLFINIHMAAFHSCTRLIIFKHTFKNIHNPTMETKVKIPSGMILQQQMLLWETDVKRCYAASSSSINFFPLQQEAGLLYVIAWLRSSTNNNTSSVWTSLMVSNTTSLIRHRGKSRGQFTIILSWYLMTIINLPHSCCSYKYNFAGFATDCQRCWSNSMVIHRRSVVLLSKCPLKRFLGSVCEELLVIDGALWWSSLRESRICLLRRGLYHIM